LVLLSVTYVGWNADTGDIEDKHLKESMRATEVLIKDHRTVDTLFSQWKKATDNKTKTDLLHEITKELSAHSVVEEQIVYPAIRRLLSGSTADESIHEHTEVKILLDELNKMEPTDTKYTINQEQLITSVTEHVKKEETEIFPQLEKKMNEDDLRRMGWMLVQAKKVAPTQPHPNAPTTPPGNLLAGPMAALFDKITGMVKGTQ